MTIAVVSKLSSILYQSSLMTTEVVSNYHLSYTSPPWWPLQWSQTIIFPIPVLLDDHCSSLKLSSFLYQSSLFITAVVSNYHLSYQYSLTTVVSNYHLSYQYSLMTTVVSNYLLSYTSPPCFVKHCGLILSSILLPSSLVTSDACISLNLSQILM